MTDTARTHAASIRVRYAETDQMGIAHHAEYFAWFEVGRTELLRAAGLTYRDLEARGVHFPVIGTEARFLRPAYYELMRHAEPGPDGTMLLRAGAARVAIASGG